VTVRIRYLRSIIGRKEVVPRMATWSSFLISKELFFFGADTRSREDSGVLELREG
jgi:hypothetical protein